MRGSIKGTMVDSYRAAGHLKAGTNIISKSASHTAALVTHLGILEVIHLNTITTPTLLPFLHPLFVQLVNLLSVRSCLLMQD